MIVYSRVQSLMDIEKIKELQNKNLRNHLSPEDIKTGGFLTASYTIPFLEAMNRACPAILAKMDGTLVGYALAGVQTIRHEHVLLEDLFNKIDETRFEDKFLKDSNYVVVSQLCVEKAFRGMGVAQKLYQHFQESLSSQYDYCITDVHEANIPSLRAHKKTGFQIINTLEFNGDPFVLVLWDWNKNSRNLN